MRNSMRAYKPWRYMRVGKRASVPTGPAVLLWNLGYSLRRIRETVAPNASLMSVSRAVRRGIKLGAPVRPFVQYKSDGTPARPSWNATPRTKDEQTAD